MYTTPPPHTHTPTPFFLPSVEGEVHSRRPANCCVPFLGFVKTFLLSGLHHYDFAGWNCTTGTNFHSTCLLFHKQKTTRKHGHWIKTLSCDVDNLSEYGLRCVHLFILYTMCEYISLMKTMRWDAFQSRHCSSFKTNWIYIQCDNCS